MVQLFREVYRSELAGDAYTVTIDSNTPDVIHLEWRGRDIAFLPMEFTGIVGALFRAVIHAAINGQMGTPEG